MPTPTFTLAGIYLVYGKTFTKNLKSFPLTIEEIISKKEFQKFFEPTFHGVVDIDNSIGILHDRNGVSTIKFESVDGNFNEISFSKRYAHSFFEDVDFKFSAMDSNHTNLEKDYVGVWRKKSDGKILSGFASMLLIPQSRSLLNVDSVYIKPERMAAWREFLGEEKTLEDKGML